MAAALDMGIVITALGTAAWYTGRVFWRTRQGGSACSGCPSGGKSGNQLVQLRRAK